MIKLDIHVGGNSFAAEVDSLASFPDLVSLITLWLTGPPKIDIADATVRVRADATKITDAATTIAAATDQLNQTGV